MADNRLEEAELSLNDLEIEATTFTLRDEERHLDDIVESAQVGH